MTIASWMQIVGFAKQTWDWKARPSMKWVKRCRSAWS